MPTSMVKQDNLVEQINYYNMYMQKKKKNTEILWYSDILMLHVVSCCETSHAVRHIMSTK